LGADRKASLARWGVKIAAALGPAALFYWITLSTRSLGGYDWVYHYPYYDWIRTSLRQYHTLPLYMDTALITPHFLANPETPLLGPLGWLLYVLPTAVYLKFLILAYATAGLLGMFALLRDEGIRGEVAIFGAVVFAFNGFFPSHIAVGHHWALGVYLFPAVLCLFRRGARGNRGALCGAAALNVACLLDGGHHPFIWQHLLIAMLTGLTCLQLRAMRPAYPWIGFVAASFGLGAVKLIPMIAEFRHYAPQARIMSLPPAAAIWSLLGRGQDVATSRPDLLFKFGAGWWEYAFYVGALALTLTFVGLLAARRSRPLLLAGCFFLALSLDLGGWAHWADVWQTVKDLPVWRSQRAPSRFMIVAMFAFLAVAAGGLQSLLDRAHGRPRIHRWLRTLMGAVAFFVAFDLHLESRAWQRSNPGTYPVVPTYAPNILVLGHEERVSGRLVKFTPERFTVVVKSKHGAVLVLRDEAIYSAQWRVSGGRLSSRQGHLAVIVPPGERTAIIVFAPRYWHLGLAVSTLTALAAVIWVWLERRKRPPGESRAPGCS